MPESHVRSDSISNDRISSDAARARPAHETAPARRPSRVVAGLGAALLAGVVVAAGPVAVTGQAVGAGHAINVATGGPNTTCCGEN